MNTTPAYRLAATILHGFEAYRTRFKAITLDAQRRFQEGAWRESQQASIARINLYQQKVDDAVERLKRTFSNGLLTHREVWGEARSHYAELISPRLDVELAETFFNSLFCAIFKHRHIRNEWMFVISSRKKAAQRSGIKLCRCRSIDGDWQAALRWALEGAALHNPFADIARDTRLGTVLLNKMLPSTIWQAKDAAIELLYSVFYRNKGAYIVGRITGGGDQVPLVLPVRHQEHAEQNTEDVPQLHLDTVLITPDDVAIIFSFSRAYFQVDVAVPNECVGYLQRLMPHKPAGELYAAIGFFKHGKTEFFRALNQQVAKREDVFIIAPGVRGMVMAVFVLPSARTVFKIIKDEFDPAKDVTPDIVREKYHLVKRHDRVGRMADTQEFSNFTVHNDHFAPECLAHLLEVAPSTVSLKGEKVVIKHCYTERMMTPLNIYLEQCDDEAQLAVLRDYGDAIKQMAAANIFPGDMLLKNFGVTRQGRVIFYDYDEVCYLTECHFRAIPASSGDDYLSGGNESFSIGPNDIFPEEFGPFMFANPERLRVFKQLHPELFEVRYWQGLQQAIVDGRIIDVYPYGNEQRFVDAEQ
ncbi:Isocitrate dehydrogenase phosphatase/kinase [Halomonas citrativorans]|uniref:Isocitrate dehydrogenase kinase/phosphatase n=1 Tax=Halomonas citrativorans TaxID=2742612 RepID=A0A1R4HT10_9GAMM|nr:bifunctional isocitrate dehydrogenase kinase/phosphatase [Halomonas citrativorans]SJN10701.1 Isocitrate dehydrogenase phosphatase/kinase [Halomonas citrativorans]